MAPKAPQPGLLGPGAAGIDIGQEHCLDAPANQKLQYPATLDLGDLRFQRAVERLHRLGPRVLYELLVQRLLRTEIESAVNQYAALDPELLRELGADSFPASPMRLVEGGR